MIGACISFNMEVEDARRKGFTLDLKVEAIENMCCLHNTDNNENYKLDMDFCIFQSRILIMLTAQGLQRQSFFSCCWLQSQPMNKNNLGEEIYFHVPICINIHTINFFFTNSSNHIYNQYFLIQLLLCLACCSLTCPSILQFKIA